MISLILNVIGLLCILYGIISIRKDFSKKEISLEELNALKNEVKEYYELTEQVIVDFNEIIDVKLDKVNKSSINSKNNQEIASHSIAQDRQENNENLSDLHKKTIELKNLGLTVEEIAKRLNKGKREVEIILKIYNDKKNGKTI